jgi:diguanylate cyclase (GGDEF)-like protein
MVPVRSQDEVRASSASWLCRDDFDRQRMLDMDTRVRPMRRRAFAILAAALIIGSPWVGLWPLLFLIAATAAFAVAELLMPRPARPEYMLFAAWVLSGVVIAVAVALAGSEADAALSWLAIPVITLGSRFSMRGVALGVAINIGLVLAVGFGVDTSAVLANPPLVLVPIALILCVAVLSTALMRSDIRHPSDAVIDQLTGMLNRTALNRRVEEVAQQSQLTGDPVAIIVGDLDLFKAINDARGHAAGDFVLKEVAYLLRKQLRAFDLAYRLGGEEFLILLPGSDVERAGELAEQLREGVSSEGVAGGVSVTMSFGVGASGRGETFDYQTVFGAADAALYRAKQNGRDQVCLAGRDSSALASLAVA